MAHISNYSAASDVDLAIPELWAKRIRVGATRRSFWGKFTGKEGSNKPIIRKDDLTKESGDTIHIDVLTPLKGAGVTGESQLQGNEEKLVLAQFDLTVDVFRHAVSYSTKAQVLSFLNLPKTVRAQMQGWLQRELDDRIFATSMPWSDSAMTVLYADNAGARASIATDDYLDVDDLMLAGMTLSRMGAIPFRVIQTSDGQEIDVYACVVDPIQAHRLRGDSKWTDIGKYALPVGERNPLLTGAIGMVRGMLVYEYKTMRNWQGSMLRPEGQLVVAYETAVDGTVTIGADDGRNYTKFFPSTGELCVRDATAANIDAYTYTGKNSYQFTGVDNSTQTHAIGTPVELSVGANVEWPVARCLCFGAEMVARGYAKYPWPIAQLEDYGFLRGLGIAAIEGTAAIENEDGDYPNHLIIESAGNDPGAAYT